MWRIRTMPFFLASKSAELQTVTRRSFLQILRISAVNILAPLYERRVETERGGRFLSLRATPARSMPRNKTRARFERITNGKMRSVIAIKR